MTARKTIIESLRVDGFGRFHDFELELGDGLNVLAGPNEAGKSTLWSFISAMLFGFERRHEPTRYEPVGGSAFGGELRLKTGGGQIIVRRQGHKRRVDGEVSLRDGHGAPVPDSRLDEARGQVSRELFAQVFSLTIDQLRHFSDLAGSEVSERLFAAAMQGAVRLPTAMETLRKEAADLFLPKGQRPLNAWFRELHDVRIQLDALGDRPAVYAADRAQRTALETALTSLETDVAKAAQRVADLERVQKALGPLEVLRRAEAAQRGREALADFPLEAAARVDGLVKSVREATAALRAAEQASTSLEASVHAATQLLARCARPEPVRAALRQWDTVLVRARELPAAMAQLDARRRQLLESMKRLPVPSVSLESLLRIDVSVAIQTELKSLRDRHAQARDERTRVMAALTAAREELGRREERRQQLALAIEGLDDYDLSRLDEVLGALSSVGALTQRRAHLAAQHASTAAQVQVLEVPAGAAPRARFPLWLAGGATVAMVLCAMAAWALGAGPTSLVFALALGLIGLVAALRDEHGTAKELEAWERAQQHRLAQRTARTCELKRLEREIGEVEYELTEALRVGAARDVSEVGARMAWAQGQIDQCQRREVLVGHQAEAVREAARVARAVEALEDDRARADTALDVVQVEVDARLAPLGISASLSAEAALDVVLDVHRQQERALTIEAERAGLEADAKRVALASSALEAQAEQTGATQQSHVDAAPEPATLASMLGDWLEADSRERAHFETLRARLEAARGPLEQQKIAAQQANAELEALLLLAGVASVEAFRHRASEAQAWASAEVERRSAVATIAALGGDPETLEGQRLDAAPLAIQHAEATAALEAARLRREQTLEALGRLKARLERFEHEDDIALLRREEEALVSQLRRGVEQYTVSALARAVLEQTRVRFDAEQQPRVVQRAATLFTELTDGRYVHVRPEAQARVLTVRDAQGIRWHVEQLSRGTRELLLLAFRLAVIEDFGEVRVALPVLLDDVTVNLDTDRASRVIEVLARLSKHHQILAFTCHTQVRALFREAGARVHEVVQRTQLSLLQA